MLKPPVRVTIWLPVVMVTLLLFADSVAVGLTVTLTVSEVGLL